MNNKQDLILFNGRKTFNLKTANIENYPEGSWISLSGEKEWRESAQTYFKAVPWLYRGTTMIADAVCSVPFSIWKGETEVDTSDDWQNAVGFIPNPKNLLWLISACLTLEPYCYLFSENVGKLRKRLRYILPDGVEPVIDPIKGLIAFKRMVNNQVREFEPVQDIVYFWRPDPYAEQYGYPGTSSPGKAALMASGVIANVDEFVAGFFKRGAIKVTLFTAEGMQQADAEKFQTWWERWGKGVKNAFRTKILNTTTMQPIVVGEGLEGLQDNNLVNEKREDISTALGIPQTKLFSSAASGLGGGGVVSQDDIRFYKEKILPDCEFIASVLNEQVLEPLGYKLLHKPTSMEIFQADEAQRAATALPNIVAAISTPKEFLLASKVLGFKIDKDVEAELEKMVAEKEKRAEEMAQQVQQQPATAAQSPVQSSQPAQQQPPATQAINPAIYKELSNWRRKCIRLIEEGKAVEPFIAYVIPSDTKTEIENKLKLVKTVRDVDDIFDCALAIDEKSRLELSIEKLNALLEKAVVG